MKKSYVNPKVFRESYRNSIENTVNFENCSSFVKYNYEDKPIKSSLGLCLADNYILTTVVPYLKEKSSIKIYDIETAKNKYYGKPMKLSLDEYGVTDFWWIILAVNGYFNPRDFINWESLIIPTINEIEAIIDKEAYVNKDFGVIPT